MSIFGINDSSSSAYSSILSKSKENKENNQVKFANAMIKDNVTKLSGIQTQNTFTLAKNEILNSNPLDNPLQNSIYALKYKQGETNKAVSMAYGYGVDSQGYMTSDFNKAAGLPEDFKIHKSTLEEIERYNQSNMKYHAELAGIKNYFDNFDMTGIVKKYFNQFNQIINHSFNDTNKTSFSEADLESLPKGLSISPVSDNNWNWKSFDEYWKSFDETKITNYYSTQEQVNEIKKLEILGHMNAGLTELDFTPQSMQTQNLTADEAQYTFNPDMSVYSKNEKGEYPKEALFMSFLKGMKPIATYSSTINPIALSYERSIYKDNNFSSIHLDEIMTGKVDFTSLLKKYALDGWLDGDIYAYENGVKLQDNLNLGYGGAWFDRQFNQAKANGWKASSESINSYVTSVMDRLNNLINQTRA